jgi:hypothetical protein
MVNMYKLRAMYIGNSTVLSLFKYTYSDNIYAVLPRIYDLCVVIKYVYNVHIGKVHSMLGLRVDHSRTRVIDAGNTFPKSVCSG